MNAATKNAIDYLHREWRYKPFGMVCYGGASHGLRAAQVLKPSWPSLKMPLAGDVSIALAARPSPTACSRVTRPRSTAVGVLDELARGDPAL